MSRIQGPRPQVRLRGIAMPSSCVSMVVNDQLSYSCLLPHLHGFGLDLNSLLTLVKRRVG